MSDKRHEPYVPASSNMLEFSYELPDAVRWRNFLLGDRRVASVPLDSLERAGLVTLTEDEELMPARDLENIALCDVLNAVRDEREYATWLLWRARTEPVADEVANSLESAMRERIEGMTLRELAARQPA